MNRLVVFVAICLLFTGCVTNQAMKAEMQEFAITAGKTNKELRDKIAKLEGQLAATKPNKELTDKVVKLESQVAKIETAPARPQAPPQPHPQTVELENKVKQLAEKVDKVEKTTFELAARISEPEPQMKMGIQKVEIVQDNKEIQILSDKLADMEKKVASINNVKRVEVKPIYFPTGKKRVEDLPKKEMVKIAENIERIKEERPQRVIVIAWSDSKGDADMKKTVAMERAENIKKYYISKTQEFVAPEFTASSKVAAEGQGWLWRRAETSLLMGEE